MDDERRERMRASFLKEREEWKAAQVKLLGNIKANLQQLEELLAESSGHWCYEDPVYRFYHQSFKVYGLQKLTGTIVERLKALLPGRPLDEWFEEIVKEGTGKVWKQEDNENWTQVTRPIVEAFFHARYFLQMVCKYGKELEEPPQMLPSGWAAVLCLYGLR